MSKYNDNKMLKSIQHFNQHLINKIRGDISIRIKSQIIQSYYLWIIYTVCISIMLSLTTFFKSSHTLFLVLLSCYPKFESILCHPKNSSLILWCFICLYFILFSTTIIEFFSIFCVALYQGLEITEYILSKTSKLC